MCGIAGVRSFSPDDPIRADQIVQLLLASEHRGKDACGVALQERDTGKIQVYKSDDSAGRFVQKQKFEEFLEEHLSPATATAILHTRAATSSGVGDNGHPRNNDNNHPMWRGLTAVVHNGCISNHKILFERNKYERSCNTDSDILRAILDDKGIEEKGVKALNDCWGGAAIAAVSEKYPEMLLLARSGSPLVVGAHKDQIVFASERGIVHAGFRKHEKKFGFWIRPLHVEAGFTPFPADTAWLFDRGGLVGHWEFKTSNWSQGREWTSFHRQERKTVVVQPAKKVLSTPKDDEVMFKMNCKNPKCPRHTGMPYEITRKQARDLHGYMCKECGFLLDGSGFGREGD